VLCSKPKTRRKSHYPWTKNGGQVSPKKTITWVYFVLAPLKQLVPSIFNAVTLLTSSRSDHKSKSTKVNLHFPKMPLTKI
jgi:hypothetical protein